MDRLEAASQRAEETPHAPSAWLQLADALLEVGAEGPARHVLTRARACDPVVAEDWFELGRLAHQLGDAPGALEALRAASVLDPDHRAAVLLFARVALETGNRSEALERLEESSAHADDPELGALLEQLRAPSEPAPSASASSELPLPSMPPVGGLSGDLEVFRLEEILEFLGVQRATGELHLTSSAGAAVIELGEGRILEVRHPGQRAWVEALAVELGVPREALEAELAPAGAAAESPTATAEAAGLDALVNAGRLSRARLEELARERVEAGVGTLLTWTDGNARFEKKPMPARIGPGFTHQFVLMSVMKSLDEIDR